MSNLDKKLEKLLNDFGADNGARVYDAFVSVDEALKPPTIVDLRPHQIEKIKQTFIEDGWVQVPQIRVELEHDNNNRPTLYTVMGKEVMTGKEWYGKFQVELAKDRHFMASRILKAARKASGVDK